MLAWLRDCTGKSIKLKDLLHLEVAKNVDMEVLDRYTYHSEHYIWVKQSLPYDTLSHSCCQVQLLLLSGEFSAVAVPVHKCCAWLQVKIVAAFKLIKCALLSAGG